MTKQEALDRIFMMQDNVAFFIPNGNAKDVVMRTLTETAKIVARIDENDCEWHSQCRMKKDAEREEMMVIH